MTAAVSEQLTTLRAELASAERDYDRADNSGDTAFIVRVRRMLALLRLQITNVERRAGASQWT